MDAVMSLLPSLTAPTVAPLYHSTGFPWKSW